LNNEYEMGLNDYKGKLETDNRILKKRKQERIKILKANIGKNEKIFSAPCVNF